MTQRYLAVSDFTLRVGTKTLLNNSNLKLTTGKYGLIGDNGSGKSTLITQLVDKSLLENCSSYHYPAELRIGYAHQEFSFVDETPLAFLTRIESRRRQVLTSQIQTLEAQLETIELNQLDSLQDQLAELYQDLSLLASSDIMSAAVQMLLGLGFSSTEIETKSILEYSGGYKMRLIIAAALIEQPDFLFLDEPNNHLDIRGVIWLTEYLSNWTKGLVVITHDIHFLQTVTNRIIHLTEGQIKQFNGNYADYRATIRTNQGPSTCTFPFKDHRFDSTNAIISLDDCSLSYQKKTPIFKHLSLGIYASDKIGLLAPNGVGKTTFLNLLMGNLAPSTGTLTCHRQLKIIKYDQEHADLAETETGLSLIQRYRHQSPQAARNFLAKFGLRNHVPDQLVSTLSGGQKTKLYLAVLSIQEPNLIILDEPTNNLDLESIQILAKSMAAYQGAILLVSHDRFLLESVCSQFWVIQDQQVLPFEGDYEDYAALIMG